MLCDEFRYTTGVPESIASGMLRMNNDAVEVDCVREDDPVSLVLSAMPFGLRASNRAGVKSEVLVVAEHPIAPRTEDKYTPSSLW